jgi:tetratricopeptide (TPR) repeat protein
MTHAFRLRGSDPVQDGDERLPNDALREARVALDVGDVARASSCIATLRSEPELSRGATWLAMALGAVHEATRSAAAAWLEELADPSNFPARRALVARAIELGDGARVARVLETDGGFTAADRAVLATLHGVAPAPSDIDALAEEMPALAAALTSLAPDGHTAGTARASVLLGRLLAAHPSPSALSAAVRAFGETAPPAVRLVSLEAASRAGQFGELYDALLAWPSKGSSAARDRAFAAGLLAERVGDPVRAQAAYKLAHRADPAAEAPLRALASLDSSIDLVVELTSVADEIGDGARGATLRLEAVARADSLEVPTRLELLERAHQADPSLGLAAFSAERIARRAGYTDEVLKWIREQPKDDPLEAAVHTVREALAGEPESVGPLLEPLHRAYPADAALRLLLERTDPTTLQDHAQWREARAKEASGAARTVLLLDAASLYEQGGHPDDALRLARRCLEDADADFARVLCNRLAAQDKDGLLRDLEAEVRGSSDPREPLERLAELDPSTALSRHQQILQTAPKYLPSLRFVEHALLGQAADHELAPVARAIAEALGLAGGSETAAHAELARQLGDNDSSLIALATSVPEPSLAALRALWNQDRPDPKAFLESTEKLTSRLSSPMDLAFLHVRAAQAALEINDPQSAQALLEQATQEDAGDIVAWEMLAKLRTNTAAAEAFEALARASAVKEHQCEAWYEAQRLWSEHDDEVHAIAALEALVQLDVAYRDAFQCLADLYRKRGAFADLATLLEQRRPNVTDPAERVLLDLERGSSLREAGLDVAARDAFEQVLAVQPDHPEALEALGDLYDSQGDYAHAEQAWVSLVRLLSTPDGQRMVYAKLGELYSHKAVNLARAEVALREVLKRTPEDVPTLERLAGVLARANDIAGAVQVQQDLLAKASTVDERRRRVIELATLYETANEPRKAEQEFEKARRASPTDVHLLQALAEFYVRHKQTPAFNILLDRASSDARRSIGAGRVVPAYFQVLQTAYALRGRQDAARVVEATHAAFEGRSVPLRGAEADALDPSLDSLLAPEAVSPALRTLLARTGDALDAAAGALDLRTLRAGSVPAEAQPLGTLVSRLSRDVTWHFSEDAPGPCIPITPAGLLFGPSMLKMPEQAQVFLVIRSLKLLQAHAAAFLRGTHVGQLVLGWLHAFNPTWQPEGVDLAALGEVARRVGASLPKNLEPDIALLALEVAGSVGTGAARTGQAVVAWANRVALLAVGDPQAALEALGANLSHSPEERAAWIVKTPEVRDLLAFSVTDAYGEARSKLGLDH